MFSDIQSNLYDGLLDGDIEHEDRKSKYEVILIGVNSKIEKKAAFAIKFSLIAKLPVTRANSWINNTPAIVWEGFGKKKAKKLLSIIEESGGEGKIRKVEMKNSQVDEGADKISLEKVCFKCGFPIKDGEKFCSFCTTPINAVSKKRDKEGTYKVTKPPVPKGRMVFYLIVIVVLCLFALLSS